MSSTISFGMYPSSTASATALPTAVCAGPNTLAASSKSPTVTLGIIKVVGLYLLYKVANMAIYYWMYSWCYECNRCYT